MNLSDTKLWVEYHSELCRYWGDWVKAMPKGGKNINIALWQKMFTNIDLADAKQASDDMITGVIEQPYNVEEHAKAVKAGADAIRHARNNDISEYDRASSKPTNVSEYREQYRREWANGLGLLNQFVIRLGLLPEKDTPYTRKEALLESHKRQRAAFLEKLKQIESD
jgi:hypothetical protein